MIFRGSRRQWHRAKGAGIKRGLLPKRLRFPSPRRSAGRGGTFPHRSSKTDSPPVPAKVVQSPSQMGNRAPPPRQDNNTPHISRLYTFDRRYSAFANSQRVCIVSRCTIRIYFPSKPKTSDSATPWGCGAPWADSLGARFLVCGLALNQRDSLSVGGAERCEPKTAF